MFEENNWKESIKKVKVNYLLESKFNSWKVHIISFEFSFSILSFCFSFFLSFHPGIRLLSSSKNFLNTAPNADIPNLKEDSSHELSKLSKWNPVWKPKSHTKWEKHVSSISRKRANPNNNKETNSSSEKCGTSSSDR